jgi:hypothetical protein
VSENKNDFLLQRMVWVWCGGRRNLDRSRSMSLLSPMSKDGKWGFLVGSNGGGDRKREVTPALWCNTARILQSQAISRQAPARTELFLIAYMQPNPGKTTNLGIPTRPARECFGHPITRFLFPQAWLKSTQATKCAPSDRACHQTRTRN